MYKAFDTVFQKVVDARIIAKTSYTMSDEGVRYQCLCCGEEVYLAAANSTEKTPHFRHRKGNNDIECERYLGQPGAIEEYAALRRENNKTHVAFFFNKNQMTFEIGLVLTDEEIDTYCQNQRKLCLYTKYCTLPFLNIPISRGVLRSNELNYYTITEYSNDYYVSLEGDPLKFSYPEIIKKGYKINIYRINKQDEHYKKNMSGLIYTDVEYVAISESKMNVKELVGLYGIEVVKDESNFVTMGRAFYVVEFVVRKENYEIKRYFQKHGYKIETSESLEILWPPMYSTDTTLVTTADTIYVSSSFRLIPHGNINIVGDKIEEDGGVYKISIDTRTIINEKNIDVLIVKNNVLCHDYSGKEPELIYLNKFNVPNDYDYFLFSKDGCVRLISGSNVSDEAAIASFFEGLTGKEYDKCIPLFGKKEDIKKEFRVVTDAKALVAVGTSQVTAEEICDRIRSFAKKVFRVKLPDEFSTSDAQEWLFDNLPDYEAYVMLHKLCRDGAKPHSLLRKEIFGESEYAADALDALLIVVSLAKKEGNILFPVRLHMFVRGLQGLYACSNPKCTCDGKKYSEKEKLPLGKVISIPRERCDCGARIYELVNHVKCGALYLKVYVQKMTGTGYWYAFPSRGLRGGANDLTEMLLYICPVDYELNIKEKLGYLDPVTGKLYLSYQSDETLLKVVYPEYDEKNDYYMFKTCPKCKKGMPLKKPTDL